IDEGRLDDALRYFDAVLDAVETPKFFLHWYWRLHALFGRYQARARAADVRGARVEADRVAAAAPATAQPNLQAMALVARAGSALAEKDRDDAATCLAHAESLVERFGIPTVAWRVHALAWRLGRGDRDAREATRRRAQDVIRKLAAELTAEAALRLSFVS